MFESLLLCMFKIGFTALEPIRIELPCLPSKTKSVNLANSTAVVLVSTPLFSVIKSKSKFVE